MPLAKVRVLKEFGKAFTSTIQSTLQEVYYLHQGTENQGTESYIVISILVNHTVYSGSCSH